MSLLVALLIAAPALGTTSPLLQKLSDHLWSSEALVAQFDVEGRFRIYREGDDYAEVWTGIFSIQATSDTSGVILTDSGMLLPFSLGEDRLILRTLGTLHVSGPNSPFPDFRNPGDSRKTLQHLTSNRWFLPRPLRPRESWFSIRLWPDGRFESETEGRATEGFWSFWDDRLNTDPAVLFTSGPLILQRGYLLSDQGVLISSKPDSSWILADLGYRNLVLDGRFSAPLIPGKRTMLDFALHNIDPQSSVRLDSLGVIFYMDSGNPLKTGHLSLSERILEAQSVARGQLEFLIPTSGAALVSVEVAYHDGRQDYLGRAVFPLK